MNIELEELKQQLCGKRFSIDEVRPLMERAARVIDRLQAENLMLAAELKRHRRAEPASGEADTSLVMAGYLRNTSAHETHSDKQATLLCPDSASSDAGHTFHCLDK